MNSEAPYPWTGDGPDPSRPEPKPHVFEPSGVNPSMCAVCACNVGRAWHVKASGRPATGKFSGRHDDLEDLGDIELSPEQDAAIQEQIRQADSERSDASSTIT